VVHKWTKCTLPNGKRLIEGNFVTEDVKADELKSALQKSEIVSCGRDGQEVLLKCTGCVTSNGVHVGITGYANVGGQWTQCRKFKEGCRLINVTTDCECGVGWDGFKNGGVFLNHLQMSTANTRAVQSKMGRRSPAKPASLHSSAATG